MGFVTSLVILAFAHDQIRFVAVTSTDDLATDEPPVKTVNKIIDRKATFMFSFGYLLTSLVYTMKKRPFKQKWIEILVLTASCFIIFHHTSMLFEKGLNSLTNRSRETRVFESADLIGQNLMTHLHCGLIFMLNCIYILQIDQKLAKRKFKLKLEHLAKLR
jgi:hypothetical protein